MTRYAFSFPVENNFQKFGVLLGFSYIMAILISILSYSPQKVILPASFENHLESENSVAKAGAVFRDFDRTEFREGRPKWNIKALKAEYLSGGGLVKLTTPDIKIFGEAKEKPTYVKAESSNLVLIDGRVENALLEGNVEIKSGSGTIIHTASAEYVEKESRLDTPQHVYIDGPGYHIEGDSSKVNTLTDEVFIYGHVSSKFESSVQMPLNLVKK